MKEDTQHRLTIRLPKDLFQSMRVRKALTAQSISSQLIEAAMRSEREFHNQLVPKQDKAHQSVMSLSA